MLLRIPRLDVTRLAALCGGLLITSCSDDPAGNGTASTTGAESTSTAMGSTAAVATVGTSSSEGSSGSSGSTLGPDDTTGGASSGGSGSGSSSGDPSTGSSSSGELPVGDFYGDCATNPVEVCEPSEICLERYNGAACSQQACVVGADCPDATSGTAVVVCQDIDDDGTNDCYANCSGGGSCPDGMACFGAVVCLWPLTPIGGGACPDQDLGDTVPQVVMGDNTGLLDDHIPWCGNGGGEEALYQFTAAADGTYIFDTFGSGYDTLLFVLDGCGGPELACNDDANMAYESQIFIDLVAGQSIIVGVDSYSGQVGPFILNVSEVLPPPPGLCPDQDLGSTVPQAIMGNNTGLGDNHGPGCGAGGGDDAQYQFTAPAAATYVIDTAGTMFDTVLAVLDGCDGVELACNDDTMVDLTSIIAIDLAAGESVIIVVDSYAGQVGPFNLNINAP